jgi:radical SAM protein with 4Fe4S-binding SPASM domain
MLEAPNVIAKEVARSCFQEDPLSRQMMGHIDAGFYGATYLKRGVGMHTALEHYVKYGHDQGYWPNPRFDTSFYRFLAYDTRGLNALKHWVGWGKQERRLTFGLRRPALIKADDVIDLRGYMVVSQRFVATDNYLSCIILPIGSYNNQNGSGIFICIKMMADENNAAFDDSVIAQYTFDGRLPSQHEPFTIYFNPAPHSKGRLFEISMKSAMPDDHSAAWPIYVRHGTRPAAVNGVLNPFKYGLIIEEKYSPPDSPVSIPKKLLYSPTTQCNLNCIHCVSAHSRESVRRAGADVKASIQEWAAQGKISLLISDYSGDLLWADHKIPGELDFVIGLDVPFELTTNGVHLDEERATKLLRSRMVSLNVSLDAATNQTFRRVRKGAPDLDVVVNNIRRFVDLKDIITPLWPGPVTLSFALMKSNLHELVAFVKLADRLGIRAIVTQQVQCYTDDMVSESLWFDKERFNTVREQALSVAVERGITLHISDPFSSRPPQNGRRYCPEPWYAAMLLGNGDVHACCVPGSKVGNINDESLESIWAGEKLKEFRLAVNSPSPPEVCLSCPLLGTENNAGSYTPCRPNPPGTFMKPL